MTERRNHENLVQDIANAIRSEIAVLTVPQELHAEHHAFIAEWIDKEKRKAERWDKIKTQVGGWALIAILGGIATLMWHGAEWTLQHLKP